MKNYPLNPFVHKFLNWQDTYLKELNTKIFALKNYSDFFLTDYIPSEIDLTPVNVLESDTPIYIIQIETLDFRNYAYLTKDCYLITDSSDTSAFMFTKKPSNEIIYCRYIPAGTTIISHARPEGSINANGIQKVKLWIQNLAEWLPLFIQQDQLNFTLPAYGPAHPDRSNWHNFVIQPTGYASLYVAEPIEKGIKFVYYEKGGEEYGTTLDLLLLFNNARYFYRGAQSNLSFSGKWGISITAKSQDNQPLIATNVFRGDREDNDTGITHWVARTNPLMCFTFFGRDIEHHVYGEEIIADMTWDISTTKVATVNTLVYNMNMKNEIPENISITADFI